LQVFSQTKLRTYASFTYQAGSWTRSRKVVARLECSLQPDAGGTTSTGMRQEVDVRYTDGKPDQAAVSHRRAGPDASSKRPANVQTELHHLRPRIEFRPVLPIPPNPDELRSNCVNSAGQSTLADPVAYRQLFDLIVGQFPPPPLCSVTLVRFASSAASAVFR
jgi:hypothetical protein